MRLVKAELRQLAKHFQTLNAPFKESARVASIGAKEHDATLCCVQNVPQL